MSQQFSGLITRLTDAAGAGQDWQKALKACFDEMKSGFTEASAMPDVMNGFTAFAEMPMDTLRRTFVGFSAMPGDCFQNLRSDVWEKVGSQVHTDVEKFLSVPGVGYTREGQEEMQKLSRLLLVYQRAMQDYLAAHGKLYSDALDRLYTKLIETGKKGETINSVRALYDIWVDCNEDAYAEFVMSSEFQDVYAEMVNAVMAVKHQIRLLLDENLGALNMPTRGEVNGMIKRHHELQRTVKTLLRDRADAVRPAPKQAAKAEKPAEVDALKREVAELKTQLAAAAKSSPRVTEVKRPVPVPAAKKPAKTAAKPAKRKAPSWDISSISKADEKPAQGRRRAGKR
jgi:class III poly(R)-hydroxyalkanoic acid synthase PhaE subunit